ncbi:MAG: hypothetical protein U1E12_10240 [Hydrogenophaga sp.]|uniref:hypothetical protein n=1 Tax=Hydrogenophaga sp. TaxID=1904254 RepID=UPI002ABC2288|nr:hypothetical protein [Hydrogenophaga sp.]MDZ4102041.1 hypothetical protein [Hydrogenophaga sp.]
MDNSNRPELRAYIGATGSGKGVSIREYLQETKPARFVAWDPLQEFGGYGRTVRTIPELCKVLKAKRFAVAFDPGEDQSTHAAKFDLVCRAVFEAGDLAFHVEELNGVTRASWAPQPWRRVTKQGRHKGLRLSAGTQRPADCDKDFFSGLTYCRVFTLRFRQDKAVMADLFDVPYAEIAALSTVETQTATHTVTTINCLERDWRTGQSGKKTIVLKKKRGGPT